jgi:predicted secreted Zn-dependent protease
MLRVFRLLLLPGILLACQSRKDEAPSEGSSGRSGRAIAGGSNQSGESGGGIGGSAGSCPAPIASGGFTPFTTTEHEEYYSVFGNSAAQLRTSINAQRGRDYDAFTTWNVHWSVTTCSSPAWSVSLDVGYRLPKWDPPATTSAVLVSQWQSYRNALECHEYGHGKLGLDCAQRVYDALLALPGNSDCSALSSSANSVFDLVLADCRARELKYDADTNHGATMGAIFPP